MTRPELILLAGRDRIRPSLVRGASLAFAVHLPLHGVRFVDLQAGDDAWRIASLGLIQPDASLALGPGEAIAVEALANRRGPAVLVVTLSAADGAPLEAIGPTRRAIFLSGDSTPKDSYFVDYLRPRLMPFLLGALHTEVELLGVPPHTRIGGSVRLRRERLDALIAAQGGAGDDLILIGRSAGARVASIHADGASVLGVVCLGYPFRHPGVREEPGRYLHLATMRTPTLIIQGKGDLYGGAEAAWRYARAPCVDMALIETGHEFIMEERLWDLVARRILLFLTHRCGP